MRRIAKSNIWHFLKMNYAFDIISTERTQQSNSVEYKATAVFCQTCDDAKPTMRDKAGESKAENKKAKGGG